MENHDRLATIFLTALTSLACSMDPPGALDVDAAAAMECASECPGGTRCDQASGRCVPGCTEDGECGVAGVCDPARSVCGCAVGFHRCGDTCLADTDAASCGDRCLPCADPSGGRGVCIDGQCAIACDVGNTLCGSECRDTGADGRHCGGCDLACDAESICLDGRCERGVTCAEGCPGFSYCDATSGFCRVGCETDDACTGTETCDDTTHACVCREGFHPCGGSCVADESVDRCGEACEACTAPENGVPTCVSGACDFTCSAGFHACDGRCQLEECGGCVPRSCAELSVECGDVDDGCGTTLSCGECEVPTAPDTVPGFCTESGFCFEHPFPSELALHAVWGSAPNEVWAAGELGLVIRYDGTRWHQVRGRSDLIERIEGTSPTNVWVSSDVEIARWNGSAWDAQLPASETYEGDTFSSPMFSIGPHDTWAARHDGYVTHVMRFDGSAWTDVAEPMARPIDALWVGASDDIWANSYGYHSWWNGTEWTGAVAAPNVFEYVAFGADDIYSSSGQHWDGADWRLIEELYRETGRERVSGSSGTNLWFTGSRSSTKYVTRRHAGGIEELAMPERPHDVHSFSPSDTWVVGEGFMLTHHDGTAFDAGAREQVTDAALWAISREQGARWAVGADGIVLHLTDERWVRVPSGVTTTLNGVWAEAPGIAWVAGEGGTILRCEASGCARSPTDFTEHLRAIWGASPSAIWAVGSGGRIAVYDGVRWARAPSRTSSNLEAVHGTSATHVWAAGDGVALEWDGGQWQSRGSNGGFNYRTVYAVAPRDVYFAAPDWSSIYHWDGTNLWPLAGWPWDMGMSNTGLAVVGAGDRVRVVAQGQSGPLDRRVSTTVIYERRADTWELVASAPFAVAATWSSSPAALLPDGSMRFLQALVRPSPTWSQYAIIRYDSP